MESSDFSYEHLIYFIGNTPFVNSIKFARHFKISHDALKKVIEDLNLPEHFESVSFLLDDGRIYMRYHMTLEGVSLLLNQHY